MRLFGRPLRGGRVDGQVVLPTTRVGGAPPVVRVRAADTLSIDAPSGYITGRSSPGVADLTGRGPVVGGIEPDLLLEGDRVTVDGSEGWVDLPDVVETPVVTAFLQRSDGRVLLLRRSERVGSFPGAWAAVSGFLEDPTAEEQAIREIREETGVRVQAGQISATGPVVRARGEHRLFLVHPFRFRVEDPPVTIDWEHVEYEWVEPTAISGRETVPKLAEAWATVAPDRPRP